MPYYTRSEFAKLLGKKNSFITTYIERGKIVLSGEVIDTTLNENITIMKRWGVDVEFINGESKTRAKPLEVGPPKRIIKEKIINIQPPEYNNNSNNGGQYQLDLDKKEAELEFKQVSTRIKLIEEAKLRGELVPLAQVTDLISMFSRSIIGSYKESIDQFLIEVNHRKKMSSKDSAELKGEMIRLINVAHDNSINNAIKELKMMSPKNDEDE